MNMITTILSDRELAIGADVRITFAYAALPARVLSESVAEIERAVFESQVDTVRESDGWNALPKAIRDRFAENLAVARGLSINVVAVRPGSIIVEGFIVAAVYWVFDATMLESVKAGWKLSSTHKELSENIAKRLDALVKSPGQLARLVAKRIRSIRESVRIKVVGVDDNQVIQCQVTRASEPGEQ